MKKNEKSTSKNVANMMRKIEKKELEQTSGGLFTVKACYTCGLLATGI